MNTQNNLAWYYVGVGALLLIGQSYLLNTAHKEQVAKLNAKLAAATATATAEAPAAAAPAPVSTLAATPAATPAAAPAAQAPATATPAAGPAAGLAVASAPVGKKTTEPKTIVASAAPAAASAPSGKALPVAFQFRSEPFEKNKVVTLTNTSKEKLDCTVTVVRPRSGESSAFKVAVAAAGEARLTGGEKGWKFKTGDRIQVAQAGYKPANTSVP